MFVRYKGLLNNLMKRSLKWNREIANYSTQAQIEISDPAVQRYLEQIQTKYSRKGAPQHIRLLINSFNERISILDNIKNLEDLQRQDTKNDMKDLLNEEKKTYENSLKIIDSEILDRMFPDEIAYGESECVVEINAGVGGLEAMLFGGELLNMYTKYCFFRNWSATIVHADVSDECKGLRHASMIVSGPGAHETLSMEAGVHRVQRVPETEKSGRLHTSTVSVAVLLQPSEIEIHLPDRDLRIETKRSSGAGGQHVNTTDSCVRITHIPSGLSVECQAEREQLKNKRFALTRLRALLYERQLNEQIQKTKDTKKSQIGSGFRNEKIRTYNFNQDRVTDHRIGGSSGTVHDLKGLLEGGPPLNSLIMKLHKYFYAKDIMEQIELYRKEIESSQINLCNKN